LDGKCCFESCGISPVDLPIGWQMIGKLFDKSTVWRVAHAYAFL